MHRQSISSVFPQFEYLGMRKAQAEYYEKVFRKSLDTGELQKLDLFKANRPNPRTDQELGALNRGELDGRASMAKNAILSLLNERYTGGYQKLSKAGVTSSLGYNFIDLRGPAYLLYPVNTPLRNQIPREGRVNDGYGTMAQWKATRNPGIQPIGVPEGQRSPTATPDENNYASAYKEAGIERAVTFTAEFAGEGYTDNLADEHIRGLHELWLGEEGMILNGNGGTGVGSNGYQLGTAATPTVAASSTAAAASLPSGTNVSVAVVFITGMGYPSNSQYGYGFVQSVANGLNPGQNLTGADGGIFYQPGGTSAISAMSAVQQTSGGSPSVTATVVAPNGAFAFAWYVNITDASAPKLSNAYLAAITTIPTFTVSAAPTGVQTGAATGLNVDNSSNPLDFTGLLGYASSTAGATWTQMAGASFTAAGHGQVTQIETIMENTFSNFQTGYSDIWGSSDAILALSRAIVASGTANTGYQFVVTRDQQNNIVGGAVVSGYLSRYAVDSPTGAGVIPLRIHPMLPPGTLYFDLRTNPYPHSRIGNPRAMLVQRDYYGIEWPVTSRQWTWGTYVHEAMAHRLPWIPAVLTQIGPYTGV